MNDFFAWLALHAGDSEPWASYVRYLPRLLDGAGLTLQLLALSALAGLCMALPLALARVSGSRLLRLPAYGYIFFFRGTPLLVQIYLIYYGLGQFEGLRASGWLWDDVLSRPYWCAIIAFSLNTAAYTAELLRGAIQAVPRGEIEAARALGLSRFSQLRDVILPRALRIALPGYSNEIILLLKASALASTITLLDLMGATRGAISRTYMSLEFLLLAGALYLLIAVLLIGLFRLIEYTLNHHRRSAGPSL